MTTEDKARTGTRWLVTAGLIAYGVVHLLVAWITLQIGWGGTSEEASPQGALQELAEKPFGGALLWAVAIGMFGLTLWQLSVLFLGDFQLSPAGRSMVYLALGIMAARVATGSGAGDRRTTRLESASASIASPGPATPAPSHHQRVRRLVGSRRPFTSGRATFTKFSPSSALNSWRTRSASADIANPPPSGRHGARRTSAT